MRNPEREIPKSVLDYKRGFFRWFSIWNWLHYSLGFASIILSSLLAAKGTDAAWKGVQPYIAITAAICTSLVTMMKARKKADGFIAAHRLLEVAINEYRATPTLGEKHLYDAVSKGVKILAPEG
jgi:hypothetical protein